MVSERVKQKAVALLYTGAVRFVELRASYARARVVGDSDDYTVEYNSGRYTCGCPHLGECSHILAVSKVLRAVLPALEGGRDGNQAGYGGDSARGRNGERGRGEEFFGY